MLRKLRTGAAIAATTAALTFMSASASMATHSPFHEIDPYQQCLLDWRNYCSAQCTAQGIPPGSGGHLICREACVTEICGEG